MFGASNVSRVGGILVLKMEHIVGVRNSGVMAVVSPYPIWRSKRTNKLIIRDKTHFCNHSNHTSSSSSSVVRVKASNGGSSSSSSVVVKEEEGFFDEEDYIKAGGSEILFVQMQQKKPMDKHILISDKLPSISVGESVLDLVIIGCGPAGLSLAAEAAKLGLQVGLIGPDRPFTNNYGVWEDEFQDLGLEGCIEHVWKDTIVYLDSDKPIRIGRAYGRVDRQLLYEELLKRCVESGVSYLDSKVERIDEAEDGHRLVACESGNVIPCRLVTVASGAASGKLLEYDVGGPRVSVQTAYGLEVEETCLASKNAVPFDQLKKKLMARLDKMGIKIAKVHEEEWSYIPVGGALPSTEQKTLAFGAAASMVHPATGYSVVRSLSEAPRFASVIAEILKTNSDSEWIATQEISMINLSSRAWNTLWPKERKRQRSFFLFGLELIVQLDIEGIRTFFQTFFGLPDWMWKGFLGSSLSSTDLLLFAVYMFVIAPNSMRKLLVGHLLSDPTGALMVKTYLS
ncbi:lycopene epsilon cyclase, chloroplastic-like isoform X2 [Papaver somniferum]|uniref:lycopene epsilon cyclase, chloroplastic-like isoform X2 n=1 Tax=Papaver somniferum TaxID=3469 RepID=UPI000E6F51C9|nr:lycopene epsilon cyclase, chloroplastic-like isoform X2 [Papaver somniferum]